MSYNDDQMTTEPEIEETETAAADNETTDEREHELTRAESTYEVIGSTARWLAALVFNGEEELAKAMARDDDKALRLLKAISLAERVDDGLEMTRKLGDIRERILALGDDVLSLPGIDEAGGVFIDAIDEYDAGGSLLGAVSEALEEYLKPVRSESIREARMRGHALAIREALGLDRATEEAA